MTSDDAGNGPLIPIRLATTLLWVAEAGLFQPLWSPLSRRCFPQIACMPDEQACSRRVSSR